MVDGIGYTQIVLSMNRVTQKSTTRSTIRTRRAHVHHDLPKNSWEPLPMERRLIALAIERTRGLLKGKRSLKEDLAWLRKIRTESDRRRRREQERLWKKKSR